MTGTETEIQWYIAREEAVRPLNDAELRMFIAGGHLRPTDLVWRPGMADWRQASSVFSLKPAPAALPRPPTTARRAPPRPAARLATAGRAGGLRVDLAFPEGLADRLRAFERFRIPAIAAAAAVIVVAGWVAMGKLRSVSAGPRRAALTASAVPAKGKAAPLGLVASNPEAIDASFQRTMLWSVVKREFPDWYGERLKETAKPTTDNKPEDAIAKHLVEALVALGARMPIMRSPRARRSSRPSPAPSWRTSRSSTREHDRLLQLHLAAGSRAGRHRTAAAAGARSRSRRRSRRLRGDCRRAASADAARRTEEDGLRRARRPAHQARLEPGRPAALRRSARACPHQPLRVCKMVQDWFSAHIAITDLEAQERLPWETLWIWSPAPDGDPR